MASKSVQGGCTKAKPQLGQRRSPKSRPLKRPCTAPADSVALAQTLHGGEAA